MKQSLLCVSREPCSPLCPVALHGDLHLGNKELCGVSWVSFVCLAQCRALGNKGEELLMLLTLGVYGLAWATCIDTKLTVTVIQCDEARNKWTQCALQSWSCCSVSDPREWMKFRLWGQGPVALCHAAGLRFTVLRSKTAALLPPSALCQHREGPGRAPSRAAGILHWNRANSQGCHAFYE